MPLMGELMGHTVTSATKLILEVVSTLPEG